MSDKKKQLEDYRAEKIEGIIVRSRSLWYEKGERNSKYFLGLEKRNYMSRLIPFLKVDTSIIYSQTEIMQSFVRHYREVFSQRNEIDRNTEAYLGEIDLKRLSDQQHAELEPPLEMIELD